VLAVGFHGLRADAQLFGDLLGAQSARQQQAWTSRGVSSSALAPAPARPST
jgi:hypothetical protein